MIVGVMRGDNANIICDVSPKCGNTLSLTQHAPKKMIRALSRKVASGGLMRKLSHGLCTENAWEMYV